MMGQTPLDWDPIIGYTLYIMHNIGFKTGFKFNVFEMGLAGAVWGMRRQMTIQTPLDWIYPIHKVIVIV